MTEKRGDLGQSSQSAKKRIRRLWGEVGGGEALYVEVRCTLKKWSELMKYVFRVAKLALRKKMFRRKPSKLGLQRK